MSERFVPKKPVLKDINWHGRYGSSEFYQHQIDDWYDKEIAPIFENAVEVYGCGPNPVGPWGSNWELPPDTHRALLINIQPIKPKEETAEDLLRELIDYYEKPVRFDEYHPSLDDRLKKAKAFLEKKK